MNGEKRVKIQKCMGLPELLLDCDGVLLLPAWPFAWSPAQAITTTGGCERSVWLWCLQLAQFAFRGDREHPVAKGLVGQCTLLTTVLVSVCFKSNLEETNLCSQCANVTMTQSSYPRNSEQPKSPLSSPVWQWAAQQDLPLGRDTSQGYTYCRDPLHLNTKRCFAAIIPW